MLTADAPQARRRALAARTATFGAYADERLAEIIAGCRRLGCRIPSEAVAFPKVMQDWAADIERGR